MTTEIGKDWKHNTGEYVEEAYDLDFDVWPYLRGLGGWTIVVRQNAPLQMAEDTRRLRAAERLFTVTCAGGLTEHADGVVVVDGEVRVDWEDVPEEIQAEVAAAAGAGWVWAGVDHRYDTTKEAWVPA